MAGCVEGRRIWGHLHLSKSFLDISLLFIAVWVNALTTSYGQPPQGFLSIDCGAPYNFTDTTGLEWVTDVNSTYIMTGKNGTGINSTYRFFPERRNKYCYELSTTRNTPYLARVEITLESDMILPIQFIVSVNATNVYTIKYTSATLDNDPVVSEGIFYSEGSVMYICIQPVEGVPFISSVELRPLDPSMYSYSGSDRQYLATLVRWNVGGNETTPVVRYPDDKYDRYWYTVIDDGLSVGITSTPFPRDQSTNAIANFVPAKVMEAGWGGEPFWVTFLSLFPSDPDPVYVDPGEHAFVVLYAATLGENASQSGTMNVSLDGVPVSALTVSNQASMRVTTNFILSTNAINFSLTAAAKDWSIIAMNAVEVYAQYNFNFSTTTVQDDEAVTALKKSFSLMDWQGDPCTPVPHDWLSCGLTKTVAMPIERSCGNKTEACIVQKGFLRSTYSVTALNLTNMPSSGFALLESIAEPSGIFLRDLSEMYITGSSVTGSTFDFLITNFSGKALSVLHFSNNNIESLSRANNWDGLDNLVSLDMSQNNLTGYLSSFNDVSFINSLQQLNLSYNAMTSLPTSWQKTTKNLTILDLSHNQFMGEISSLDQLVDINSDSLQELYISNNRFTGTITGSLYFLALPNLTIANFDGNKIEGTLDLRAWLAALQKNTSTRSIPMTQKLFSFVDNSITNIVPSASTLDSTITSLRQSDPSFRSRGILLGGNPYCNGAKSETEQFLCRFLVDDPITPPHDGNKTGLIIGICAGVLAFVMACITIAIMWKLWRQAKKQVHALEEIQRALAHRKVQPPFYQYNDLKTATSYFHKDNKLGHGGFGEVYKGVFPDNTNLAVKMLFNSQQVLDEFLNEVVLITGIKHRNLVQLKGCCITDGQRMLVYEYAEKGNLAQALWGSKPHGTLDWEQRFKICVGIARGLSYLHDELQPSIIHRDIKPENILLDKNLLPKIADFGLARHFSGDSSQSMYTKIAGTLGYFSPEYATQGQLSDKVDVYSYGIVILEIISGRKCIDYSRPPGTIFLKDWAWGMHTKGLSLDILQIELRDCCEVPEVLRAINIGLQCVHHDPATRPSMSKIVTMFLGGMDVEVTLDDCTDSHPYEDLLVSKEQQRELLLELVAENEPTEESSLGFESSSRNVEREPNEESVSGFESSSSVSRSRPSEKSII